MARTAKSLKRSLFAVVVMMAIAPACTGSAGSSSSPTEPSTSASTSPSSTPVQVVTDELNGGLYQFGPFGDIQRVVATGPDGWVGYPDWAMDGPEPVRADAPKGIGIALFSADGVYSDPCHWDWKGTGQTDTGNVKVGPTVGDMVAALRANTYYTSTVAKPVTIDGYSGKEVQLQMPDGSYANCDKDDPNDSGGHVFVFSGPGLYTQGPANHWDLYLLNVHGARLIAVILSYAKTPHTDLALARKVIETMQIQA